MPNYMPYGKWGRESAREQIQLRLDLVEAERKRNGGRLSPAGSQEKRKREEKRTVRAVLRNLRIPPAVSLTRTRILTEEQIHVIRKDARAENDAHYGWDRMRMQKTAKTTKVG